MDDDRPLSDEAKLILRFATVAGLKSDAIDLAQLVAEMRLIFGVDLNEREQEQLILLMEPECQKQ